jgi:hypothetical protein
MAQNCYICGTPTIFYIWSTSRRFPKKNLINYKKLDTKYDMDKITRDGVAVCFKCVERLKEYE